MNRTVLAVVLAVTMLLSAGSAALAAGKMGSAGGEWTIGSSIPALAAGKLGGAGGEWVIGSFNLSRFGGKVGAGMDEASLAGPALAAGKMGGAAGGLE